MHNVGQANRKSQEVEGISPDKTVGGGGDNDAHQDNDTRMPLVDVESFHKPAHLLPINNPENQLVRVPHSKARGDFTESLGWMTGQW